MRWTTIKDLTMWIAVILAVSLFDSSTGQSSELCRSPKASSSCGFCTKAHADCEWCSDPSFTGAHRCDTKESLAETCGGQLVNQNQHPSKIEITKENPLGSPHSLVPGTVHQLLPQQVQLTMKPGETLSFQLKYQHLDAQNTEVYILNSETESQGVSLAFTNSCPQQRQSDPDGRSCSDAKPAEIISFNISVTLKDCVTAGDAVVSIGVGGVRDVVALYITPVCGCECEKLEYQELQSPYCRGLGNLICGSCVCSQGRKGKTCECESSDTSCATTSNAYAPQPPAPDSCSDQPCPRHDRAVCAGHGTCKCGVCSCDHGWTGRACECPPHDSCIGPDRKLCSDNGVCQCGRCSCFDSSLSTQFCESDTPEVPDDSVEPGTPGGHDDGHDEEPIEGDDDEDHDSTVGASPTHAPTHMVPTNAPDDMDHPQMPVEEVDETNPEPEPTKPMSHDKALDESKPDIPAAEPSGDAQTQSPKGSAAWARVNISILAVLVTLVLYTTDLLVSL